MTVGRKGWSAKSAPGFNCGNSGSNFCAITLTVTDSAGQSDSDVTVMAFVDQSPG